VDVNATGYNGSASICETIQNLADAVQPMHCSTTSAEIDAATLELLLVQSSTQSEYDSFVTATENYETDCTDDADNTANCLCADFSTTEATFCDNIVALIPPACTEAPTSETVDTFTGDVSFDCCLACNSAAYCTGRTGVAAEGSTAYCEAACTNAGDAASAITAFWM